MTSNLSLPMLQVQVRNIKLAVAILVVCVGNSLGSAGPLDVVDAETRPVRPSNHIIEFKMTERTSAKFVIINRSRKSLLLPGFFTDDSGEPFSPWGATWQYRVNNRWTTIPSGSHTRVCFHEVRPGESLSFTYDFFHLKNVKRGTLVRLRVGDHASEAFRW